MAADAPPAARKNCPKSSIFRGLPHVNETGRMALERSVFPIAGCLGRVNRTGEVAMPGSSTQRSLPGLGHDNDGETPQRDSAEVKSDTAVRLKGIRRENTCPTHISEPPSIQGWQVYVVDSHSLIFQVFHAIPAMTSPKGEHVNAVFGFVRDMLDLIEKQKPDALLCAFDLSGPTFRNELYADYKADRGEMPDELSAQIPKICDVLSALAIPVLACEGYEADDILATLARLCDEAGANCYLVSGDKDCRQLITDRVAVYNIRKNQVFDAGALRTEWGVGPDQVVDFQALVGDKVDNVPGVPGIGAKTAQGLLETYGTLDNLLEHVSEIAGAKGKKLLEHRASALLSRELVRLDKFVPITPDWDAARIGGMNAPRLAELFSEFGFRSLAERAAKLAFVEPPAQIAASYEGYQLIDTPEKLSNLVAALAKQSLISVDTETTHIMPRCAEIVGLSFAYRPGEAYYVPVRGPAGDVVLDPQKTFDSLRSVLENPAIHKLGQNLKYDMIVLRAAGVGLAGAVFDTMIASYLLDAGGRSHNLDDLAKRHLNHTTIKIGELIGKGKQQKRMDEVPVASVATYAAEDADIPLRIHPILADQLRENGLTTLNENVEVPLINVLADMEFTGVRVDPSRLEELSVRYGKRLRQLEQEIEELAGHPLNIASPKQLAQVLFQELGLPVVKRTKTGASTDADVLEQLAESHALPAKIVEYRQYAKLKNTYVDALPTMIHPETGRVHSSFNQVVAATGRLSSNEPNLQNIPIRSDEGREIRSAFVAGPPGWKLLAADYSQIELRVLAHHSEDAVLEAAFERDEDIHTLVASQVFGVSATEVTSAQRRSAKAVNFGVIYGQSPFGLAKGLGISQEEAAQFIDGYFATYRGVANFMLRTLDECRRLGYVSTILGRRRAIQGVRPVEELTLGTDHPSRRPLNLPERTAVNSVIQGSAADLIKLAMLAVHRKLREEPIDAKMILQIHDELVFEVAPQDVDRLARLVEAEMRSVLKLRVPLKVDVKCGDNWAECEPWEG
jgi:DNA polymerase I